MCVCVREREGGYIYIYTYNTYIYIHNYIGGYSMLQLLSCFSSFMINISTGVVCFGFFHRKLELWDVL